MASSTMTTLRKASPNEKRCIIRHHLNCYSNLAVGAIYLVPSSVSKSRLEWPEFYGRALSRCIAEHPFLSATIQHAETNDPEYARPDQLDLREHVRVHKFPAADLRNASASEVELTRLSQLFERIHNDGALRFSRVDSRPAWALDVMYLSTDSASNVHRIFISFTYSHSHGDGMSGTVFHRSFHTALTESLRESRDVEDLNMNTSQTSFPEQPDTSSTMPISLSFLLRPAIGAYLPVFVARLLGISGDPVSGADEQTWTGSQTFTDNETPGMKVTTNVEIINIEPSTLTRVLRRCKTNGIKLTSFLNYVIGQALGQSLTEHGVDCSKMTNFIATTPVNLRRALKVEQNTIGNYGGAAYLRYELDILSKSTDDEDKWTLLKSQGERLADVASNTKNQAIGLLRFVSNFASWVQGQIGQPRGCSWELSNLGSFDPDAGLSAGQDAADVSIEQMLFSQPACPFGPPFCVNAVALKNGALNLAFSWQPGAFDLSDSEAQSGQPRDLRDRRFIQRIGGIVKAQLESQV